MVLNIRKIGTQCVTKFHKNKKSVNFYIILIEIDAYFLVKDVYIQNLFLSSITIFKFC